MKVDNYQDSFSIGASMAFHFCRWIHIKGFLQSFVHKQQLCVYSVLSSKHIVCILEVLISIYVPAKKKKKKKGQAKLVYRCNIYHSETPVDAALLLVTVDRYVSETQTEYFKTYSVFFHVH